MNPRHSLGDLKNNFYMINVFEFIFTNEIRMRKIISFLFVILSVTTYAQTQISGVVTDSLGVPIPFVTVGLLSLPDSAVVKGTITDESGKFSMEQRAFGKYILKSYVVDYMVKLTEAFVIDSTTQRNLQIDLRLKAAPKTLKEVSVYATKKIFESQNGNIIVNVENSPLAKGNTVYDLLIKLPGVTVDEDKIMILGKTGVIVMIDERAQVLSGNALINLLKSMNADLIESIEVLKNPPVKYDASGTSGMINIKSKKVTITGLTGTVFTSASQGFYGRIMSGGSLNYKSRKLVFYSNLSGEYGDYGSQQSFNKKFASDTGITNMKNNTGNVALNQTLNYKAGLDWMPSGTDILGIKIEGSTGNNTSNSNGANTISGYNSLGFEQMAVAIRQPDVWNSNNFDANYERKLDTLGSSLAIIADYTTLTETLSSTNSNVFYDPNGVQVLTPNNYRSNNANVSNVLSGRADIVKVIDSLSSFQGGLKVASVKTTNDYLFERDYLNNNAYVKDPSISNTFQYQEVTYAGYVNYLRTIKKLSMQLGARVEKTLLTDESEVGTYNLNRSYLQLFPNLSLSYKKDDDNEFQLNLLRRTNRPNFSDLNPFMLFLDQYSYQQGNPFLLPDYTSRGELTYNYKGMFSASVAYSYTQDVMLQYFIQDDATKTTIQTIKNMKSSNAIEYSMFYQRPITKIWDINLSAAFSYLSYQGDISGSNFNQTGISYYGNLSNIVILGKNLKLEINGIYVGPNIYGVVQLEPKWMASAALKMSLFKKHLDLTLGMDDVFDTFISRVDTRYENQDWSSVKSYDTRRFKVSLNYKFGKIRVSEHRINASNEEEKGRLNH